MRPLMALWLAVLGLLAACAAPAAEQTPTPPTGGQGLPTVTVFHSPT
ncbi:MAG: hypothetical protein NZ528_13890 [Caldilineales bacterium]|nr:hypothetical protein [Caldilineales bacterium]MDW8318218.1 hypothetical protein [Anaerolineae bacterium]